MDSKPCPVFGVLEYRGGALGSVADKMNIMAEKTRETQKKKKITIKKQPEQDMFTRLCNKELGVECIKEYQFYKQRKWRFDYAIPLHKIALEVEGGVWIGGRHNRAKGFLNDMEKYNTAALLGWRVFRTTPENLITEKTLLLLKNAVNGAFFTPKEA